MDNNNSIRFEHTPYHNVYLKDRKNIEYQLSYATVV